MKLSCPLLLLLAALNSATAAGPLFHFAEVNDGSLALSEGNRPVLVYNHGLISRTNVPADRARSSYVHPLYGLDGEVLTDDFPKDHYHHRGLFWAWPHVRIGEQETDLWLLKGIRHQFERWLRREAGESVALLGVQNAWMVGDRKVVQEQVWLKVWPATDYSRAIDLELILTPLNEPLTLRGAEGKSYGGLTLRFAPRLGESIITTPAGRDTNDLLIAHLPWADLSAQFAGAAKLSGAAVFIAPAHPAYPPEFMTRHYGVLCVGWPGVNARTFPPGQAIRLSYRIWVHRGAPGVAALQTAYDAFARAAAAAPPSSAHSPARP